MMSDWYRKTAGRSWAVFVVMACTLSANSEEIASADAKIRFNEEIRPVLTKHCTACHGGVKQAGDLSFVYAEKVMQVIEPGDPESSYLLERVLAGDDERMPPAEHGPRLSEKEVELLKRWIKQGAHWEAPWAFQQPKRAKRPSVKNAAWPCQPIDTFILSKMEAAGVQPAADEIPLRWLRRAAMDITGLPATTELRETFIKDYAQNSTIAREHAVDALLASPHFGERWASVWLDQVRYADSMGLGLDGYRSIWKYRDWVIDAFNQDMPYDQFTMKQIAGDLLPDATIDDQIATAVHRLTQSNEEGGTDDEEFRIAAVLDRASTTWQAWQGITFGCVQCHSHPYDPIKHEEFYQFTAFFNNTIDCDLNEDWPTLKVPVNPADHEQGTELWRKLTSKKREIWNKQFATSVMNPQWKGLRLDQADSSTSTQINVDPKDDHDEFYTSGTLVRDTDITLTSELPDEMTSLTAVRLTILPLDPVKAASDSEWGFVLSQMEAYLNTPGDDAPLKLNIARVIADEPFPIHNPNDSLNDNAAGFSAYSRINQPRQAAFVLKDMTEVPAGSTITVKLKHRIWILASFALVSRRGHLAVTDDPLVLDVLKAGEFTALEKEIKDLTAQQNKLKSTTIPVLAELQNEFARPSHLFIRGSFLTKGDEVQPGVPESLPPMQVDGKPSRLDLAKWIASPENPLTARVAVNRVWAQLLGHGLVATEEDFGSSGELPSHPELLDDLAVRFQTDLQWSHKALIRELVLSSTYRQSSKMRTDLDDAANILFARGPRQTLSAEMVRDQALAASGLLNRDVHGPPCYPPLAAGVWTPFKASDKWETPPPGDPQRYRRSIYTYVKRSIQYPLFAAFDAPTREFCAPRRLRSNTPLQSLMTLNSESFNECSQALAARMTASNEDIDEQIHFGFVNVTGRDPKPEEVATLKATYERIREKSDAQLAMTSIATILLNLDEIMTR